MEYTCISIVLIIFLSTFPFHRHQFITPSPHRPPIFNFYIVLLYFLFSYRFRINRINVKTFSSKSRKILYIDISLSIKFRRYGPSRFWIKFSKIPAAAFWGCEAKINIQKRASIGNENCNFMPLLVLLRLLPHLLFNFPDALVKRNKMNDLVHWTSRRPTWKHRVSQRTDWSCSYWCYDRCRNRTITHEGTHKKVNKL